MENGAAFKLSYNRPYFVKLSPIIHSFAAYNLDY